MSTWPSNKPDRTGIWPFRDGDFMMATPADELAEFVIKNHLQVAISEAADRRGVTNELIDENGRLTIHGYWRIVLFEEKRIRALKRQVNRLIANNTIEGDEEPYLDEGL